ncbi:MAG: PsiF family protein [Betaproteobacteria bacterium]
MKKLCSLIAIGLALSFGVAHAAEGQAKTPQQNKMTDCNKQAVDKKGDERKAFMKTCLSAKPAASAAAAKPAASAAAADKKATQQDKMKTCNAQAKGKKGDERKAFMKECLSK